jgi:hypothetical protein
LSSTHALNGLSDGPVLRIMVCAGPVGQLAHRAHVHDVLHRVGRRLEEHQRGRGGERRRPLGEHLPVDVVGVHAPPGEQLIEDDQGRAEQGAGGHDPVAGLHQRSDRGEHGGHPGRRREARLGALEQAQLLLEHADGRVAVARVDEPVQLAGEGGLGVGGARVDVALGEEQAL